MLDPAAAYREQMADLYRAEVQEGEAQPPNIAQIMALPAALRPWLLQQFARWLNEHHGHFHPMARHLHECGGTDYFGDIKKGWDSAQD